jgi:hypothetical protein
MRYYLKKPRDMPYALFIINETFQTILIWYYQASNFVKAHENPEIIRPNRRNPAGYDLQRQTTPGRASSLGTGSGGAFGDITPIPARSAPETQ